MGTPCINKPSELHNSSQNSKPSPRACLEDGSLDQSEPSMAWPAESWSVIGPIFQLQGKLRPWVLTSVVNYATFHDYLYRVYPKITEHYRVSQKTQPTIYDAETLLMLVDNMVLIDSMDDAC